MRKIYFLTSTRFLVSVELPRVEAIRLALMFEIAPRLADTYHLKNAFLTVIRYKSSTEGRKKLADQLLAKISNRVCFGMRNFPKLRNRILFCHT